MSVWDNQIGSRGHWVAAAAPASAGTTGHGTANTCFELYTLASFRLSQVAPAGRPVHAVCCSSKTHDSDCE